MRAGWNTFLKEIDLCALQEDMWCVFALINDATYPLTTHQSELDAEYYKLIEGASDSQGLIGKVLKG